MGVGRGVRGISVGWGVRGMGIGRGVGGVGVGEALDAQEVVIWSWGGYCLLRL